MLVVWTLYGYDRYCWWGILREARWTCSGVLQRWCRIYNYWWRCEWIETTVFNIFLGLRFLTGLCLGQCPGDKWRDVTRLRNQQRPCSGRSLNTFLHSHICNTPPNLAHTTQRNHLISLNFWIWPTGTIVLEREFFQRVLSSSSRCWNKTSVLTLQFNEQRTSCSEINFLKLSTIL